MIEDRIENSKREVVAEWVGDRRNTGKSKRKNSNQIVTGSSADRRSLDRMAVVAVAEFGVEWWCRKEWAWSKEWRRMRVDWRREAGGRVRRELNKKKERRERWWMWKSPRCL